MIVVLLYVIVEDINSWVCASAAPWVVLFKSPAMIMCSLTLVRVSKSLGTKTAEGGLETDEMRMVLSLILIKMYVV